jgi:hypothetical protein
MIESGERYTTALRNLRDGRCLPGECLSTDRVRGEASSTDSHGLVCHHCHLPVCVACQAAPVDSLFGFCGPCGREVDRADADGAYWEDRLDQLADPVGSGENATMAGSSEVPMLHEVWDDALANGRCPVCAAGLPHIGSNCPEDPSRRIDTLPPVLSDEASLPLLPRPSGRPWASWEGFSWA